MNIVDIAILVLAGVLVVLGFLKGVVRIVVGLAALVAAFLLASRLHDALAIRLQWTGLSEGPRKLVAYLLIFIAVLVVGRLVAWLARKLVKAAALGWLDRLAGGSLGLVAAAVAAALIVLPVVAYTPAGSDLLRTSMLIPYVAAVADFLNLMSPRELADRYRRGIHNLRKKWGSDVSIVTLCVTSDKLTI